MNKRIESKYIISYIKIFESFEKIFMENVIREDLIKDLYNSMNTD